MSDYEFDLLVLGGGSGGVAAARRAAERGAKVGVCEDDLWGGTCVNRGCVPKKLFVYASEFGRAAEIFPAYGWTTTEQRFNWKTLVDNVTRELKRLRGFYHSALSDNGVARFDGTGIVTGPNSIEVNGKRVTAERILLAVGGKPWVPDAVEGKELAITSDDVFWLEEFPKRILIVGSGFIGTEFAGIFRGLGSEVFQSFRSEFVLPGFDIDLRSHLAEEMTKQGVIFLSKDRPLKLESSADGITVTMDSGRVLEVDQVMMATGRKPRTRGIGLEKVGVKLDDDGLVKVNDNFQTAVPSIYAIGDCIGHYELTPVAIAEGRALADHFYNDDTLDFNYGCVPVAVFSSPPVGTVGFTEDELRSRKVRFDIYRTSFRPMKYTLPDKQNRAMLKLLVNPENHQVLGCHLVGPETPELIQVMAACMVTGVTKTDLDRTFAVHPTLAEELVLFRRPTEKVEGSNPAPDCRESLTPGKTRE